MQEGEPEPRVIGCARHQKKGCAPIHYRARLAGLAVMHHAVDDDVMIDSSMRSCRTRSRPTVRESSAQTRNLFSRTQRARDRSLVESD